MKEKGSRSKRTCRITVTPQNLARSD